jgi:mRNA interferase HicA
MPNTTDVLYTCIVVTSQEFKRWLKKQGCTFETTPSGDGHIVVRRGSLIADLPMHGKQKELGTGLINTIKKQLGLK